MTKKIFQSVHVVLLDIDGTMIDSNQAHAKAWSEALAEQGFRVPYQDIRVKIGMGGDHILPLVAHLQESSAQGKEISRRRGEIFREKYLPGLKAFPGARGLLELLTEMKKEIIVCSSASKEDLQGLLRQADIADLLDKKTSSDDADRSKPYPDIIMASLKKSQAGAAHALMIGDTPYDVQAASRAGVRTLAFTCGGWGREDLQGAIDVLQGPWELVELLTKLLPSPRFDGLA